MIQFSPSVKKFFISLVLSIKSMVSISGRLSTHSHEMFFHKSTTSLLVSLLIFQQLRYNLLGRVLSKLNCGRSWHFLLHSVIRMIYLLFFLSEALWCCSFHSSSRIVRIMFFVLIHLTGVVSESILVPWAFDSFHFQSERCRNWSLSFLVHLVSTGVLACTSYPLHPFSYVFQPIRF